MTLLEPRTRQETTDGFGRRFRIVERHWPVFTRGVPVSRSYWLECHDEEDGWELLEVHNAREHAQWSLDRMVAH